MKTAEIHNLTKGATYKVRVRYWDFDTNSHKPGKSVRRQFVGTETRFGEILCAVFTSALAKGRIPTGILSVPHYDILACEVVR